MKLFNKLDRIITDRTYKIIIKENIIDIINYIEIKDFTNKKIIIKHDKGLTTINGDNLVVSRMQDNEVLIEGKITTLEL